MYKNILLLYLYPIILVGQYEPFSLQVVCVLALWKRLVGWLAAHIFMWTLPFTYVPKEMKMNTGTTKNNHVPFVWVLMLLDARRIVVTAATINSLKIFRTITL